MTKENKVVAIQEIKDLLQDTKVVYIADLEGLNAEKTSELRRQAFKNKITVKVVKNTLLQKAMEQIEGVDFSQLFPTLKGNTAIMIAETANAPAKLIKEFRKKSEKPSVKSAYVQETFYIGDENLDTLVNIKSREEMIGEIIGLLQSPIRRLLSALENKSESLDVNSEKVESTPDSDTNVDKTSMNEAPPTTEDSNDETSTKE